MENKYFMHRIKLEDGALTKGIEVHDTYDAAVLSFHNYRALWAKNNPDKPNVQMVSIKVKDIYGNVMTPFSETWVKDGAELPEKYFMHYVRKDGDSFTKNIDDVDSLDAAVRSFDGQMAYGYGNPSHSGVSYVSCEITDINGNVVSPYEETWIQPE